MGNIRGELGKRDIKGNSTMTIKYDIEDEITEILGILNEPVWYYNKTNDETADLYEKNLQRIAERCGALQAIISQLKE